MWESSPQTCSLLGRLLKKWPSNVTHVALNLATIHAVQHLAKFRGAFSSGWSSRLKPDGLFKQGWSVRTSACDTESFWGPSLAPLYVCCGRSFCSVVNVHLCFPSASMCPNRFSEICWGEPLTYNFIFLCQGWANLFTHTSALMVED